MTTVLELITHSLQDIGVLGAEENPSAADAAKGFSMLNNMISSWNTEDLMIYSIDNNTFDYVPNQLSYTIGIGGNFNIARPVRILSAYNRGNSGLQTQVDYPIEVTTDYSRYSEVVAKNITTSLPVIMYDDGNYPLKNLTFWPVPSTTDYRPSLWSYQPLSGFASLSETLSLPNGYEDALEFNLAVRCSIPFGKQPSVLLSQEAVKTKANIKRINYNSPIMQFDPALTKGGVAYNLYSFLSGV